jgi:hypothetical protein
LLNDYTTEEMVEAMFIRIPSLQHSEVFFVLEEKYCEDKKWM